jgi:Transposase, Mutator family
MVAATVRTIFAQPDREGARETIARISRLFERRFPKLVAVLQEAEVDILAFHSFPLEHRRADLVHQRAGAAQPGRRSTLRGGRHLSPTGHRRWGWWGRCSRSRTMNGPSVDATLVRSRCTSCSNRHRRRWRKRCSNCRPHNASGTARWFLHHFARRHHHWSTALGVGLCDPGPKPVLTQSVARLEHYPDPRPLFETY